MYLRQNRTYYGADGQQNAKRAPFLLLLQLKSGKVCPENTFACVRRVALRQFGHFMMGKAKLGTKWVSVSGAYGNDGLPMDVDELPKDALPLPPELYAAWNNGGGWNGTGNEVHVMRAWALKAFKV